MALLRIMRLSTGGLIFLAACHQPKPTARDEAAHDRESPLWRIAEAEAARRLAAIDAEIAASPAHPWAGRYVLSDQPTTDRLAVAPLAGYVLISGKAGSCCKDAAAGQSCGPDCPGSREAVFGDIIVTPQGRLRLALELSPGNVISAGEYAPIARGSNRCLVPADGLEAFGKAAAEGLQPQERVEGGFFVRIDGPAAGGSTPTQ
ncbi:MAG: hypothetical protein IT449_10075 [Phycisphaerales bacterium]|nr:hypothetical protein [Phycisphaerales bacterium]